MLPRVCVLWGLWKVHEGGKLNVDSRMMMADRQTKMFATTRVTITTTNSRKLWFPFSPLFFLCYLLLHTPTHKLPTSATLTRSTSLLPYPPLFSSMTYTHWHLMLESLASPVSPFRACDNPRSSISRHRRSYSSPNNSVRVVYRLYIKSSISMTNRKSTPVGDPKFYLGLFAASDDFSLHVHDLFFSRS